MRITPFRRPRAILLLVVLLVLSWAGVRPSTAFATGQTQWRNIDLRGMGFVTGIASHPATDEIYVRTDVGGIFRWDGAAARWTALLDEHGMQMPAVRYVDGMALDPRDPLRIYVAFGAYVEDGQGPNGILRSTDGGRTWSTLTGFSSTIEQGGNSAWRHAGDRLVVDPSNSSVLYFGTRQDGLWRSLDSGTTWTRIATSLPLGGSNGATRDGKAQNAGITFVAIDPATTVATGGATRSSTIYLGIMEEGVWRSTDGGESFTLLGTQPTANANPIQGRLGSDGTLYVTLTNGVWRWRGGAWANITPPVSGFTYSWRQWAGLAVDPSNPDRIAINDNGNTVRDLFISSNGGANWRIHTSDSASAFPTGTHRAVTFVQPEWIEPSSARHSYSGGMIFAPGKPQQLWATTGYAVYVYRNLAATPVVADGLAFMAGLEELVGMRALPLPLSWGGGVALGAMDKGGFLIQDPTVMPRAHLGTRAIANSTGFGVSAQTDTIAVAFSDPEYSAGEVLASDDRGQTWRRLGKHPSAPASGYGMALGGNIAVSATNRTRMVWIPFNAGWYSGNNHRPVYSVDGGATWQLAQGLVYNGGSINFSGANNIYNGSSSVLAADAVEELTFYAYHEHTSSPFGGSIFRSTDGGANWSLVSERTLPSHWLAHIEARPGVARELWFTDRSTSLRRSTNGGATWQSISGWQRVSAFGFGAALPGRTGTTLYVLGRRTGDTAPSIYYSTDDGATWTRPTGQGAAPLDMGVGISGDLARPGRVFVATTGRGFFYVDLISAEVGEAPVFTQPPSAASNPVTTASTTLSASATDAETPAAQLSYAWTVLSAPHGGAVSFSSNFSPAASASTATFTATGTYVLRCTVSDADRRSTHADLSVNVQGVLGALEITPGFASVPVGGTQAFAVTARTTHGLLLNTPPAVVWSTTGGRISSGGLYTAGDYLGGPYLVEVRHGTITDLATVTNVAGSGTMQVVRWRGDYVSAHQNFRASNTESSLNLDGGSTANDVRRMIPWDLGTPLISPGASYAGPSDRFYGGIQRVRFNSNSAPALTIAAVRENGALGNVAEDAITLRTQTGSNASTATHAFFVWLKDDFSPAHRAGPLHFTTTSKLIARQGDGAETNYTARWANVANARWVVREDTRWFVSQAGFSQASEAARTLSFTDDEQDGGWAEISPATDLNLALGSLTYSPRNFRDLTGFGVYLENDAQGTNELYASIEEFLVEVSPRLPGFALWQQSHWPSSLDASVIGPGADPDGDGMSNLLEYALGTSPTNGGSLRVPRIDSTGGHLVLSFARHRADLVYIVEASSDLVNWSALARNPGTTGGEVSFVDPQPLAQEPRRFLRLRIEMPWDNE